MQRTSYFAVAALAFTGALSITTANAQTTPAAIPSSTPKTISTPDKLSTPIGKLTLGWRADLAAPSKRYDNLDRTRGVTVYLDNLGAVAIRAFLSGLASQGADAPNHVAIFEQLMDSQSVVLTANTSTLYAFSRTDLAKDGPTVIEVPPGMLGFLDDDWERFVGDLGVTGPDKEKAASISSCRQATMARFPTDISC